MEFMRDYSDEAEMSMTKTAPEKLATQVIGIQGWGMSW